MTIKNIKPYSLFWAVSILILLIQFLILNEENSYIDINIHDTYYVIETYLFSIALSIIYFLFGLGYFLSIKKFNLKLYNLLTWIHTFVFIGAFVAYWILFVYDQIQLSKYGILHDSAFMNIVLLLMFLLMLLVTPIFIINLIFGKFRKKCAL
jgi:hypothetical protein